MIETALAARHEASALYDQIWQVQLVPGRPLYAATARRLTARAL